MKLIEKLKNIRIVKGIVYFTVGMITYPGLVLINSIKIRGTEHIQNLPRRNVLFVSITSPALREEMSYSKTKIIDMLNKDLQTNIINDIVFK